MRNGYKIEWTEEADHCLENIIEYLKVEWGEKALSNFARKLQKRLELLAIRPRLFPKSGKRGTTRRSVLTKQITIYYKVNRDTVLLLSLFDNRKDPKKIPR